MSDPANLAADDINDLIHGRVRLAAMAYIAGAGDADCVEERPPVRGSVSGAGEVYCVEERPTVREIAYGAGEV